MINKKRDKEKKVEISKSEKQERQEKQATKRKIMKMEGKAN